MRRLQVQVALLCLAKHVIFVIFTHGVFVVLKVQLAPEVLALGHM